ncbi:hypothetical protein [Actinoplanes sp. DH11]|uniref:hypothetical protein n=1 Tax=Actinoplanes sp. DH11 TaxID=2857011 RepID=UPI001E35E087|nr:hypothetical protein [Actinoplanes sp. DH11]
MSGVLAATRDLLTLLDPLPYRRRLHRLAQWASTAPDRAAVCADLREQGPYERRLALLAALVTRDATGIGAAVRDEQPAIRSAALSAALRAGMLTGRLGELSAKDRRRIYRELRRLRRTDLADAMIREVGERHGDGEAAAVLPACGEATVRSMLPGLEHAVNLSALARRHPAAVLERVRARLAAASPAERAAIWRHTGDAVLACAPGDVLDLLEDHAPPHDLPGPLTAYGILAAVSPSRVARLLAAPGRAPWLRGTLLPPALLRRLAVLPVAELAPIARVQRDYARALAALLRAVAPGRRGELYDASLTGIDTSVRVPTPLVVSVLPVAVRIREATRVLGLPEIQGREELRYAWSAYLGWPEASAALEPVVRAGNAEVRARGWRLLIGAALRSRDPRIVAELAERLTRLRNEQDPVRSAALLAFAGAARLLTAASAPALTRVTTDAVEARDGSAATTGALSRLAAGVLQHHVGVPELRDWALLTIDLVSTVSAVPLLHRFDLVLRRGQETMVFDRLRGWVEASMARGWYGPLFALARALGRRAWRIPGLQQSLRRAFEPSVSARVAREAIGLWLDEPRVRSERVAEVLAVDATAIVVHPVWDVVCSSRTDLLDRVLGGRPHGRFVEAGARWVPAYPRRPQRWLPRQQARFVALQQVAAADTGLGPRERAAAIRAAAPVPVAGRELVMRYVDDPDVVIAEAALGALIWTDRPAEALTVLLGHAGDDRARVALYAAGRAAAYVPPGLLPGGLGPVLTGPAKVTSRKEAARLLARYGPPEAMTALLAAYRDPQAHRDVRAAIVAAARQRPDIAANWEVLTAAGAGTREEAAAVLAADPYLVPERFRPRYGELIAAGCRAADREVRRVAFQRLPYWVPWVAAATGLAVDRVTDLGERVWSGEVAGLVPALGGDGLGTVLERLAARDAHDDAPGGPGSDRPARRRISAVVDGVSSWASSATAGERAAYVPAARSFRSPAMLVALARWDGLDEAADLCAGRPVLAVRIAALVGDLPGEFEPDVADRLGARGDLAGGLFAVALAGRGAEHGWAPPWRDLVLRLREHRDEAVREEAYEIDMT